MFWAILLSLLALILVLPFSVKVESVLDGLLVKGTIGVKVFGLPLKTLIVENTRQDPFAFYLRITRRRTIRLKGKGKKRPRGILPMIQQHLDQLSLKMEIGIPDRADLTAISVGMIQALALPVVYGLNDCPKEIEVRPVYGGGRFFLEARCIFRFCPVNIIVERIQTRRK